MADIPLLKNKYLTKDVDKGNDELVDMKQAVVTIHRKGLDKFEGQSKGYTGWFKVDSVVLKTTFSTIHSELYKEMFEKNIEDTDTELYTMFIVQFDKELSRKNMKKYQT